MNSLLRTLARLVAGLATCLAVATPASAQTPQCQTLFAGKTINVGTVCVSNDITHLTVTYSVTASGWTLDETHLFVGGSTAEIPQTPTGNPKVGHFPYTTNSEGSTQVYKLPLADFGVSCPTPPHLLTIAAHAVVRNTTTVKTETAWGSGTRMNAKGNWATYFNYTPVCPSTPVTCAAPETAFAKNSSSQTFADIGLANETKNGEGRWGWQMTVTGGQGIADLWAGAGRNDTTKGTLVGYVSYSYYNGLLDLTYQVSSGFGLQMTHVYAGDANATTIAPGRYGNQKSGLGYTTVTYTGIPVVDSESNGILVIAHAEVCKR